MHDDAESNGRLKQIGIVAALVALALVAWGIFSRSRTEHALTETADATTVRPVAVVNPAKASGGEGLTLPGNIQAYNSAPIYARTNGYVQRWFVDIGDAVRGGQTLAVLDAPEVDQQLAAAKAQYQTALANQKLAKTTAVRWQNLLGKDAVSHQEADEKNGDLAAKTAVTNAAAADVKRLEALYGFTRITAPFAGIVSSRSTQIGQLVTAGTASSTPLFTVSDVHRMRTYVRVPQAFSSNIHDGQTAQVSVPEYPGRAFDFAVTRSAGAVDQQSGTMLVELQADNRDHALKPGSYAQVHFSGDVTASGVRLPGSAILFNQDGNQVAIVGPGDRVSLRKVKIDRDEGKTVVITAGLKGDERVIDYPPDDVAEGDKVHVTKVEPAAAPAAPKHHG